MREGKRGEEGRGGVVREGKRGVWLVFMGLECVGGIGELGVE